MEEMQHIQAPIPQKDLLRRGGLFFTYLLIFPLLLQFIFGAFSFSETQWFNWFCTLTARGSAGALFILLLPRLPRKGAWLCLLLGSFAAAFFNLLDLFLLVHFGSTFDPGIITLAKIAPWHEVKGFITLFLLRFTTLAILIIYPAAGVLIFTVRKRKALFLALTALTGSILFFLNIAVPPKKLHITTPAAQLKSFLHNWQTIQLHKNLEKANSNIKSSNTDTEATYVLVIGESHSRRRSSLYGFAENTTPQLKKMFEEKKIFRFDNAVTPHVMTHLALPELLTFYDGGRKHFSNFPTLPDLFRKANFKVWYIYNQTPDTEKELPYLAAAKRADHFISLTGTSLQPDGRAVDTFAQILKGPEKQKFIILHLLGNHWAYDQTYPRELSAFTPPPNASLQQKILSTYDNSLFYLDKNVARLIQLLEAQQKNSFLLYLSDHGESLYEDDDFAGHTDLFPTAATAEIPMILWLSPHYVRPQLKKELVTAVKRPFLSTDLPHLVTGLAGVESEFFVPERFLLNSAYQKKPRRVSTRGIDYETMKNRSIPVSEP